MYRHLFRTVATLALVQGWPRSVNAGYRRHSRSGLAVLVLAHGLTGCGLDPSRVPSAPSPLPSSFPPPVVTTMSVNTGSTGGGTPLRIIGSGFQMGVTVTFGGARVDRWGYDPRVPGGAPAHVAGLVDVIVTNPDGQSLRLANAYEYLAQQSFDFNGSWDGGGSDGSHIGVGFTIRDNVLITASCNGDGEGLTTVSLSSSTADGEFSADTDDGFRIRGRIVSPSDAIGRITAPSCGSDVPWQASRLPR
jgi:hypothetical protein